MVKERNEEQDTIYLVPNAHFDALWVFTKEEHLYINRNYSRFRSQ